MTTKQVRRHFTAEEKAAILKRHLIDKVSISDLSDEYQIKPSVVYEWQRRLMEQILLSLIMLDELAANDEPIGLRPPEGVTTALGRSLLARSRNYSASAPSRRGRGDGSRLVSRAESSLPFGH